MLTLIAPYGCVLPGVVWSPAAAPGEGALSDCHQQGDPLPWSNDPNLVTAPLQGHAAAWTLRAFVVMSSNGFAALQALSL